MSAQLLPGRRLQQLSTQSTPSRSQNIPACFSQARSQAGLRCRSPSATHSRAVKAQAQLTDDQHSQQLCELQNQSGLVQSQLKSQLPKLALGSSLLAAAAALSAAPAFAAIAEPAQALAANLSSGPYIPGLLGDDQIREGFVSGFLLILFSELGDKTFFIAVLLALKYRQQQGLVFAGTFGALAIMTVISVGLGLVLHQADNFLDTGSLPLDDIVAVALLLFFGIQTLRDAATADEKAKEEEEEAGETVDAFNSDAASLVLSTFALVFAAEWGDKSFLATIALAAASSPVGVVGGAVTGHGVATAIAVVGGNVLSKYVSEKAVQYIGGSLFLLFAAAELVDLVRGV